MSPYRIASFAHLLGLAPLHLGSGGPLAKMSSLDCGHLFGQPFCTFSGPRTLSQGPRAPLGVQASAVGRLTGHPGHHLRDLFGPARVPSGSQWPRFYIKVLYQTHGFKFPLWMPISEVWNIPLEANPYGKYHIGRHVGRPTKGSTIGLLLGSFWPQTGPKYAQACPTRAVLRLLRSQRSKGSRWPGCPGDPGGPKPAMEIRDWR